MNLKKQLKMAWSEKDLQNLKEKGFSTNESKLVDENIRLVLKAKNKKIEKISVEKNTIGFILMSLKQKGLIKDFVTEHQFDHVRKYRFDWAILDLKLGIEFEGLMSEKSRHTTVKGYSGDCTKYNLCQINGWRVLRYTVLNYKDFDSDMKELICIFEKQNRTMRQHDTVSNNQNKNHLL